MCNGRVRRRCGSGGSHVLRRMSRGELRERPGPDVERMQWYLQLRRWMVLPRGQCSFKRGNLSEWHVLFGWCRRGRHELSNRHVWSITRLVEQLLHGFVSFGSLRRCHWAKFKRLFRPMHLRAWLGVYSR